MADHKWGVIVVPRLSPTGNDQTLHVVLSNRFGWDVCACEKPSWSMWEMQGMLITTDHSAVIPGIVTTTLGYRPWPSCTYMYAQNTLVTLYVDVVQASNVSAAAGHYYRTMGFKLIYG